MVFVCIRRKTSTDDVETIDEPTRTPAVATAELRVTDRNNLDKRNFRSMHLTGTIIHFVAYAFLLDATFDAVDYHREKIVCSS